MGACRLCLARSLWGLGESLLCLEGKCLVIKAKLWVGRGGKGEMGGRGSYPLPSSWLNAAEHVQGVGLGFHSSVANTVRIWQCFCFWCAQVELATHAAVWGCCFLNSSPSSPPRDPFSIIEVVSAGPPALCIWGNVPKGVAEQRAHPLGCIVAWMWWGTEGQEIPTSIWPRHGAI